MRRDGDVSDLLTAEIPLCSYRIDSGRQPVASIADDVNVAATLPAYSAFNFCPSGYRKRAVHDSLRVRLVTWQPIDARYRRSDAYESAGRVVFFRL